ncbi:MAG: EAL domain-containing protein [Gammaproteobacteria bacterium]|nr:MAG: EAL domain-containing protein [Gammaproteobacteria bacterium]
MSIFPAKVAFADDDPGVGILIRETLERSGFQVVGAETGQELLDIIAIDRPDIIILDIMMPDIDGYEVCRRVRRQEWGRTVPVLIITACDDEKSIEAAYESGATDFITKPVSWNIFGHRVKYLVRTGRMQKELEKSQNSLEYAQKISGIGSWHWQVKNDRVIFSEEASRIVGGSIQDGVPLSELRKRIHVDDREGFISAVELCRDQQKPIAMELRIVRPQGQHLYVITNGEPELSEDGSKVVAVKGVFQDISERKRQDDQIIYLAFHDNLTGLPNPRLLKDKMMEAIDFAMRYGHKGAILFFDLDRFKRINETLGHTGGDKLLQMVAERVVNILRGTDCVSRLGMDDVDAPVARLGGDEFIVLLSRISDISDVAKIASRVIDSMAEPFILDDKDIVVTASIGISVFPDEGQDPDVLMGNANSALQSAKKDGGNRFSYYESKMNSSAADSLSLENDLRKALKNDEFLLYYQPQVNGRTGEIVGVEGLLRWQNPERGLVAPFHFIPMLEETGLIVGVGDWVLRTACLQHKKWQEEGRVPITISVNISVRQFAQEDFLERVMQIVEDTGADPKFLRLEITESLLLENAEYIASLLEKFRDVGFGISIDDFGTGYSSLSYLRKLPIDELKIDRSFVKDLATDLDDGTIAKTIIALAKNLRLKVIAEGVEIEEQLHFLLKQGCMNIQGYYFGKPVPPEELDIPFVEK